MSQFIDAIRIALAAIWAGKLRSFMTVLGNIVAVTSIIAVVSIVQGMNDYVSKAIISDVGADSFTIDRRGVTTTQADEDRIRNNPRVTMADAEAIRAFSSYVTAVMADVSRAAKVEYRDKSLDSVSVRGVSADYTRFAGYSADKGRLPSPSEVQRNHPVALIGSDTAAKLFGDRDPLDQTIQVEGVHFRVVGVNEVKGAMFGNSQDQFVLIPLGSYFKLFGVRQSLALTVKPIDTDALPAAMDDARTAMRIERRLRPREPDNFGMFTSDTILAIYHQMTNGIFAVLIGVVALSLVVGGIVIMNIMLMVVSERTREIGLRKSLGARRRDIMWQILTESTTLSVTGGVVGTGLGFVAAWLITKYSPVPAYVAPWSVLAGIGITGLVGLFFGLYPALRAARLDPIEALRRE